MGKSSILLRFVTNDFKDHYDTTLGAAFLVKILYFLEFILKKQYIKKNIF